MSNTWTTTCAGSGPVGNASVIRSYATAIGVPGACCSTVNCSVFIVVAGSASRISPPTPRATAVRGRVVTGFRTVPTQRPPRPDPARAGRRSAVRAHSAGRPRSTRSPSSESTAGRTVTDPSIATSTTVMVAAAKPSNRDIPVRNMPLIAAITVRPETSTEWPEVAAATASADSGSRPAARSSRSRRR